jgi:hypothetical protein
MAAKTKRTPPVRRPLPEMESASLRAEITLLRELVHQVGALAEAHGPVNEQVRLLDAVGRACGHLARLLRAQEDLGEGEALADEIGQIVDEMRREMAARTGGPPPYALTPKR